MVSTLKTNWKTIKSVILIFVLFNFNIYPIHNDAVNQIRQDYYNLSHNKKALTIPIYYDTLDEYTVAAAYYINKESSIGRYIVINTKYLKDEKSWSFRGTLLHELEHAIGNQLYHIDGNIWLNEYWCPTSLMNTHRWQDDQYENCYAKNKELYEEALIKKVSIDKLAKTRYTK